MRRGVLLNLSLAFTSAPASTSKRTRSTKDLPAAISEERELIF